MHERWEEITELLRQARECLPTQPGDGKHVPAPVGLLTGSLEEFEEFLAQNELELAWDALAAVAERAGASPDWWRKLAQAARLMELPDKEATASKRATEPISSDQALRIAREDAEKAYRDLSPYKITLFLEKERWYIDFDLKDTGIRGGGPHYIIDAGAGTIVWKVYEQ